MDFLYITKDFESVEQLPELSDKECVPIGDIDRVIIIAKDNDKIVGEVSVSIYSSKKLKRKSVWTFGENKYRSAWIDRIDSSVKGLGRILLSKAKEWVLERVKFCKRKNIYVASIATNFYRKCGYTRINTPDSGSDLDEDYPNVYEEEVANIMAIPLYDVLDREETYYSSLGDFPENDGFKLLMILEGEPDTENILSRAKEIIENDENGLLDEEMIMCRCVKTRNDAITQKMIEILEQFDDVDKNVLAEAKMGRFKWRS